MAYSMLDLSANSTNLQKNVNISSWPSPPTPPRNFPYSLWSRWSPLPSSCSPSNPGTGKDRSGFAKKIKESYIFTLYCVCNVTYFLGTDLILRIISFAVRWEDNFGLTFPKDEIKYPGCADFPEITFSPEGYLQFSRSPSSLRSKSRRPNLNNEVVRWWWWGINFWEDQASIDL